MTIDRSILLKYITMRKCFSCKEYICLENEWNSENKVIHYMKGVYHRECLKRDMLKSKRVKRNEEEVELEIDRLVRDSDLLLYGIVVKNHLFKYLYDSYSIVLLPNYIFVKLEEMFKGEYKGMTKRIPPEHLLEMFERQQKFLDNIYHKEKLNGVQRINYDLAVLIAKYPGFLDWKAREVKDIDTTEKFIVNKKIDFTNVQSKKEEDYIDLSEEE